MWQELVERLRSIARTAGSDVPISEEDLAGDFDPEKFDRRMAQVFDQQFYAQEDPAFGLDADERQPRSGKGDERGFELEATDSGDPELRKGAPRPRE